MKKTLSTPYLFALLFIILSLLAILAPVFAHFKLFFLSDYIYWAFQWICHQRPWRSYHLFDYQLALDARMTTLFFSLGIGGLLALGRQLPPLKVKQTALIIAIMLLPMAIDGTIQLLAELSSINNVAQLPFYESTNFIRSITGIFAGLGIAITLFPYLTNQAKEFSDQKGYVRAFVTGFIINIVMIPLLVVLWSLTSIKYKPSSLFIDNISRYPGYNYEITHEGGHSTINRVFIVSEDRYIARAKAFGKEYLINQNK